MYYRCELYCGGYAYEVTDNLANWDDVELSFKRSDYDGVVRSFSTKFEFAGMAYDILVAEYLSNYLNSSASIVFYTRTNSWEWSERFRCALDFSTFTYDRTTCQINAVDNSLAALIKAKKGTKYEYSVDVIKDGTPLDYDHLEMDNRVEWIIPTTDEDGISTEIQMNDANVYPFPMYISSSEISSPGSVEIADSDSYTIIPITTEGIDKTKLPYFFKNNSNKKITVHIEAAFTLNYNARQTDGDFSAVLRIDKYNPDASRQEGGQGVMVWYQTFNTSAAIYNINVNVDVDTNNGDRLAFYFTDDHIGGNAVQTIYDITKQPVMTFVYRADSDKIDVINPVTVLNRLLKSMNGGNDGYTGSIVGADWRLENALIVAAESARGLTGAKLYTSYTQFCTWMSSVFGFVPVVGEETVTFVHRDSLFKDEMSKDLGDGCTDFEFSVNAALIYARVNAGYDRQDYDSVNGRDEFHFTTQYTTGVTLTDNSLDLTSPYRADAYGIEFLVNKRGEETTDSDSDNDVFFVNVEAGLLNGAYVLRRNVKLTAGKPSPDELYPVISGVISPATMFNAAYSARFMIEANKRFIASFCSKLEYASSDGNSDVEIDGISEKSDIVMSSPLFTAGQVTASSGDTGVPEDLGGYVSLGQNGRIYKGYVSSVSYNLGREKSAKYTLILKSVE